MSNMIHSNKREKGETPWQTPGVSARPAQVAASERSPSVPPVPEARLPLSGDLSLMPLHTELHSGSRPQAFWVWVSPRELLPNVFDLDDPLKRGNPGTRDLRATRSPREKEPQPHKDKWSLPKGDREGQGKVYSVFPWH